MIITSALSKIHGAIFYMRSYNIIAHRIFALLFLGAQRKFSKVKIYNYVFGKNIINPNKKNLKIWQQIACVLLYDLI